MKKILGVMGSPRQGGNTDTLMQEVARGVRESGGIMEIVALKGLTVDECDGCHVCWEDKECAKKDDMNDIFPRIIDSDAVVFGTPVYWYAPTALMKAFIDRFVYFNCDEHRGRIRGKAAAIVVPYEDTDADTAAPVVDFFERSLAYLEMPFAGQVVVPGVTKRGEVKGSPDAMAAAYDLGRRLAGERAAG
jgi:multimeric flavodoxin WrbA